MNPIPAEILKSVPVTSKGNNSPDDGKGYIQKNQAGIFEISKHDEKQEENQHQADGNYFRKSF